ncbi:MAG: RNA-directed DNA polymerase (Reverse transcriptase) [Parcubacteria group bacterium Gr01-1014_20]|nr:MAG: RNA-directed DNA polymerase (Reverse transcriptase) [Parcubacteria group bacterium Gr01-1014_20]
MKTRGNLFQETISPEKLFLAWKEFKKGKLTKKDVLGFEYNLETNIFALHRELKSKTYRHGNYYGFYINDPKSRHIHKAFVKDRVVHHALFSVLNPIFEPTFIYDSYSCRKNKGSHKGIDRLRKFALRVSENNTKSCFILKCDIKKFFESVNHEILTGVLERKIKDEEIMWLVKVIIESFNPGIPIGNLTSQLFANIYLNKLDQFVKHKLKAKFYIRYTDDFVVVASNKEELAKWLSEIRTFLSQNLKLTLHPKKIILEKHHQGTDFLGYIQFPHHRLLRTKTKRRMLKKIKKGVNEQSLQSYLGVLSHANGHKISEEIKNLYLFSKK